MSESSIFLADASGALIKTVTNTTKLHPFTVLVGFLVSLILVALGGFAWSIRNVVKYSNLLTLQNAPKKKINLKNVVVKRPKKKGWWEHPILRYFLYTTLPLALPYYVLSYLFNVSPLMLDLSINQVMDAKLPPIPKDVLRLHSNIPFVADLHADTLMISKRPGGIVNSVRYGTPPPQRHKVGESSSSKSNTPTAKKAWSKHGRKYAFGHVDLDRMVEGNVALQTFSVVSQVPSGLNMFSNSNSTNLIGMVGLVSGWPNWALPRSVWGYGWWYDILISLRNFVAPVHSPPAPIREGDSPAMKIVASYGSSLHQAIALSGERLVVVTSQNKVKELTIKRQQLGKAFVGGLFSIEGTACCDPNYVNSRTGGLCAQRLYELGVRMVGLTHFVDVYVGGSSTGKSHSGLTKYGREFVMKAFDIGISIDFSHASDQVIRDTLQIFDTWVKQNPSRSKPGILVSHTGLRSMCNIPRNLDDELAKEIGKRGGIIGVTIFNEAHCLPVSVKSTVTKSKLEHNVKQFKGNETLLALEVLDRVGKAVQKAIEYAGSSHVAIGSDYDGSVVTPIDTSQTAYVTWTLVKAGLDEDVIKGVLGGNVLKWLESGWLR